MNFAEDIIKSVMSGYWYRSAVQELIDRYGPKRVHYAYLLSTTRGYELKYALEVVNFLEMSGYDYLSLSDEAFLENFSNAVKIAKARAWGAGLYSARELSSMFFTYWDYGPTKPNVTTNGNELSFESRPLGEPVSATRLDEKLNAAPVNRKERRAATGKRARGSYGYTYPTAHNMKRGGL